jgi:hypothetical protein
VGQNKIVREGKVEKLKDKDDYNSGKLGREGELKWKKDFKGRD